jgi:hypothetical protein
MPWPGNIATSNEPAPAIGISSTAVESTDQVIKGILSTPAQS